MSRWNRRGSLCTSSPPIWTADLESKVTALAFLLKMYLTTCYPIIKNVISSPLCIIHINLGTSRDSTYFVAKDESASKGDLQSMKGNNLLQQLVIYLHGVYSSCMWWMSAVVLLYLLPHRLAMKDTRPVFEFPSFPSLWWDLHSSADFSLVPIWSPGLETTLPRSGHSSWLHVVPGWIVRRHWGACLPVLSSADRGAMTSGTSYGRRQQTTEAWHVRFVLIAWMTLWCLSYPYIAATDVQYGSSTSTCPCTPEASVVDPEGTKMILHHWASRV